MSSAPDETQACAVIFASCCARQGVPHVKRIVNLAHRGEVWRVEAVRLSPSAADEREEGTAA